MHATGSRYQALGGIQSLRQRSDLGRRFPQRSLRRNRKITKDLHLMLLNQLLHVSWVIQAVKSWITRERTLVPDRLGVSSHLQRDRNQALLANTQIFITWDDWEGGYCSGRPKYVNCR